MSNVPAVPAERETPAEIAAYREAISAAELRNIRLIKSSFTVAAEGVNPRQPGWKQGYTCTVGSTYFDAVKKILSAEVEAEAFCRIGRKKVVSLKCHYAVTYTVRGNPPEEAARRFVSHVGKFAAYPYFRAHFAETSSQAGLLLPPLPVMKEGLRIIDSDVKETADG